MTKSGSLYQIRTLFLLGTLSGTTKLATSDPAHSLGAKMKVMGGNQGWRKREMHGTVPKTGYRPFVDISVV
jgi:hypothetical protein